MQALGHCSTSGSSDGRGVDVVGTVHGERPGRGPTKEPDAGATGRVLTDDEVRTVVDAVCFVDLDCSVRSAAALNPVLEPDGPVDPADDDEGRPAVAITMSDLARFLPASAALHAEPEGWAVVGVPANFWLDVRAVTVRAALLGDAAEVRFTPQAYRFDYGDDTIRTTGEPGASWSDLRQQELTATPTGHVYRTRGDMRAAATVVYSGEYRFADGPWTRVASAVAAGTPPQRVLVVAERTALTKLG